MYLLRKCVPTSQIFIQPSRTIRQLSPIADAFNYQTYPRDPNVSQGKMTGLFGIEELKTSDGFRHMTTDTVNKCDRLLNEALSNNRNRPMVQILDDLSNTLCLLADMADCVRVLHPAEKYRREAARACYCIGELVERFNTNHDFGLPADYGMDDVDNRVLRLFVADFEQSGVQLDDPTRFKKFISATSNALEAGHEYLEASYQPVDFQGLVANNGKSLLPACRLYNPLWSHADSLVRQATFTSYYQPIANQETLLQRLLTYRNTAATFSERAIMHSLAETPENVERFLISVVERLSLIASHTVGNMRQLFGLKLTPSANQKIHQWDIPFATMAGRHFPESSALLPYFSLGACMEGVSQLASCLFNLRLMPEACLPGESWHEDVVKIVIYDQKHTKLGYVYCDFFGRPGKPEQDCHYTIRGGRRINQGIHAGTYQSPIVCLQLNLAKNNSPEKDQPVLLSLDQVETLFHEWGHALHSMLARTKYQHVTGTRCSTDLAEIPSTLFESLALHPLVATQYARHWETGAKVPAADTLFPKVNILRGFGQSLEVSLQSVFALVDQLMHSASGMECYFGKPEVTSYQLLHELQRNHLGAWFTVPEGTAWTHRFGHLYGYGARYYSYMLSRAGAHMIYRKMFHVDPWSSSNGHRLVNKLLCHGGELRPVEMLSNLLQEANQPLAPATEPPSAYPVDLDMNSLANALVEDLEEKERVANAVIQRDLSPSLQRTKR